ncbi:MAG: hypothetical protein A2X36_05160 [Elusimicrobia bacterium GWA2_69_24]|nr:MAG: hypothetical protein A2X36_05160 [Elusimicrobia bacterium GWA2_69_24]HBL18752.1 hypothetical protein [Elusimicrobiota bacterium]
MPEEADRPEIILENIANLDTARMTLRWALERIRTLEKTGVETQEALQQTYNARQTLISEFGDYRKSIEDRTKKLEEKEKFVSQMQGILNDLFKGQVDVAEFVRRKEELEASRTLLEAKVRKQLQEAEQAHQREVEENAKRLADMEATYTGTFRDAQKRFHEQVAKLQADQEAALRADREKLERSREEFRAEAETAVTGFHQRMLVLEHNYAAKRRELEEDFDKLKARLLEEDREREERRVNEGARLRERWDAERAGLEALLAERETALSDREKALQELEKGFFTREETARRESAERLAAAQTGHAAECARLHQEALAAREELRRREEAVETDRQAAAAERMQAEKAVREELRRREESFEAERQKAFGDRTQAEEAARLEFGERLAAVQAGHAAECARLSQETLAVREVLRRREAAFETERLGLLQEQSRQREETARKFDQTLEALRQSFQEMDNARLQEAGTQVEALRQHYEEAAKRHTLELAKVRTEMRLQQEAFQSERASLLEGQIGLRRQDADRFAESLREAELRLRAAQAESQTTADADLEALRTHYDEVFARRQGEVQKEIEAHTGEVQILRKRLRAQQEELETALAAERTAAEARRTGETQQTQEDLRTRAAAHDQTLAAREAAHAQGLAELERRFRDQLDDLRVKLAMERDSFDAEIRRRVAAEASQREALEATHRKDLQSLRDRAAALAGERDDAVRFREAAQARATELEALRAEFGRRTAEEAARVDVLDTGHRDALQELRERIALLSRERDEAIRVREAAEARASEAEALRTERSALLEEQHHIREEELRKREDMLQKLEAYFIERGKERNAQTAEQFDSLRRHYQKMLENLREARRDRAEPQPAAAGAAPAPAGTASKAALVAAPAGSGPRPAVLQPALREQPAEGWGRVLRWALAAVFLCVAAAGIAAWLHPVSGRDYKVPFSHPTALVWQGQTLWAADWKEETVYKLRRTAGGIKEEARFPIPGTHITGMAVVGETVYIADSWRRVIQRRRLGEGGLKLEQEWPSPGGTPSALLSDGTQLWSADMGERRIYRHALNDSLTVLESFPVEHAPIGLHADAERFWSADATSRLVFRHRWDQTLSLLGAYGLTELMEGKTPLSAFTMRGSEVWLGRDGGDSLIARPLWRFHQVPLAESRP